MPEKREDLDEIVGAVLDSHLLQFEYRHTDGREERLSIQPLSLVICDHQFYVLGRRGDKSLFCYRFARMDNVDATRETFEYPTKNEYDPRTVFGPVFGIHISVGGPPDDVEVVLAEPWASFATTHRWHPSQQVVRLDDGRVRVTFQVRLCPEVESWVLGFGEHAVVVKPETLRDAIAARTRKAADVYVGDGGALRGTPKDTREPRLGPKKASKLPATSTQPPEGARGHTRASGWKGSTRT